MHAVQPCNVEPQQEISMNKSQSREISPNGANQSLAVKK